MKRLEKVNLLIDNSEFCDGIGIGDANEEYKRDYMEGFKDKEIDLFYYEFIDPQ